MVSFMRPIIGVGIVKVQQNGGRVVTLSPPTSEAPGLVPGMASSGKTGSCLLLVGRLQNPDELNVLISSALPTTHRGMTCTVLKAT